MRWGWSNVLLKWRCFAFPFSLTYHFDIFLANMVSSLLCCYYHCFYCTFTTCFLKIVVRKTQCKFTLTILGVKYSINYMHIIVQQISRIFSHCVNKNTIIMEPQLSTFSFLQALATTISIFCFYYLKYLILVESGNTCLFADLLCLV